MAATKPKPRPKPRPKLQRKLFFCGVAGLDNPGAWTKMMTEAEVRGYVSECLKKAGWLKKPFKTLRIERHPEGEDVRVYLWGWDEPSFQGDFGLHTGVRVEVDGKVVYNDLKPSEESEPGDHDDCEDCAKEAP